MRGAVTSKDHRYRSLSHSNEAIYIYIINVVYIPFKIISLISNTIRSEIVEKTGVSGEKTNLPSVKQPLT